MTLKKTANSTKQCEIFIRKYLASRWVMIMYNPFSCNFARTKRMPVKKENSFRLFHNFLHQFHKRLQQGHKLSLIQSFGPTFFPHQNFNNCSVSIDSIFSSVILAPTCCRTLQTVFTSWSSAIDEGNLTTTIHSHREQWALFQHCLSFSLNL